MVPPLAVGLPPLYVWFIAPWNPTLFKLNGAETTIVSALVCVDVVVVSVTRTMKFNVPVAVGVPEIKPVDESVKLVGSGLDPVARDHE